jgi:hypothetical protein
VFFYHLSTHLYNLQIMAMDTSRRSNHFENVSVTQYRIEPSKWYQNAIPICSNDEITNSVVSLTTVFKAEKVSVTRHRIEPSFVWDVKGSCKTRRSLTCFKNSMHHPQQPLLFRLLLDTVFQFKIHCSWN